MHLLYLLTGQLQILKLEPKFSLSSRVLGRCLCRVSGRNMAVTPPITDNVPMMTKGSTWL